MKITPPLRRMTYSFFLGNMFFACIYMLLQDWYGLEGYIDYLRRGWTDLPWAIWLIPMLLVLYLYYRNVSQFAKDTTWMTLKTGGPKEDEPTSMNMSSAYYLPPSTQRPMPPAKPPRKSKGLTEGNTMGGSGAVKKQTSSTKPIAPPPPMPTVSRSRRTK